MSRFWEGASAAGTGTLTMLFGWMLVDGIFLNPQTYAFVDGVIAFFGFLFMGATTIFLGWPNK